MRLDSFQYFTNEHPPEHLGPILARNRFDGSVAVIQTVGDPREWLALVGPHEFVRGALVSVDLFDEHLGTLLDECGQRPKFRGLFHCWNDAIPPGVVEAARRGLPMDLKVTPAQLPDVASLARTHPDLPIAIVHLGSPEIGGSESDDWARGMADLARLPNIFCKASDLIHLASGPWKGADLRPYMQHVLAAFSPARVMFGSGWPAGLPDRIWKETLAAFTQAIGAQPMEVREELLGGTAQRFYGIAD